MPTQFSQSPNGNYIFNKQLWEVPSKPTQIFSLNDAGSLNWCVELNAPVSTPIIEGMAIDVNNNITFLAETHDGQLIHQSLFQLNELGEKNWDIDLDLWINTPINVTSNLLSVTSNNDLVFAYVASPSSTNISFETFICGKVSQDGEILWNKRYDMGEHGYVADIFSIPNDDILLAIITNEPNLNSNLLCNNSFGETIWSKSYNDFLIYKLGFFPNGDLGIYGRMGEYPVLMRTNNQGRAYLG